MPQRIGQTPLRNNRVSLSLTAEGHNSFLLIFKGSDFFFFETVESRIGPLITQNYGELVMALEER